MVHAAETPPIEVEELLLCRIQEWYDRFKSSTFKTILIELDDDVVEWLLADGVSASGGNQAVSRNLRARVRRSEKQVLAPHSSHTLAVWQDSRRIVPFGQLGF